MSVIVVAIFRVKEGIKPREAEDALRDLIEKTHDEAGCQSYALHRKQKDPRTLVMVERWTSQVALENHLHQPYVKAIGPLVERILEGPPQVHFLDPVEMGDPMKGTL